MDEILRAAIVATCRSASRASGISSKGMWVQIHYQFISKIGRLRPRRIIVYYWNYMVNIYLYNWSFEYDGTTFQICMLNSGKTSISTYIFKEICGLEEM